MPARAPQPRAVRPFLCESLARQAPEKVDLFLVDGRAFTPSELDKCNATAKPAATKALAAQ